MGRAECDPPIQLLATMLAVMKQEAGQLDALLVPGDLVGHGIPLNPKSPKDDGRYEIL